MLDRLSDSAVLVLLVITGVNDATRRVYPNIFDDEHLSRRRQFYDTGRPDHLPLNEIVAHYEKRCGAAGLRVEWSVAARRWAILRGLPRATNVFTIGLKVVRAG